MSMNPFRGLLEISNARTVTKPIEVGDVFGRLTVTDGPMRDARTRDKKWHCVCSCGRIAGWKVDGDLKRGTTKSCGCLRAEIGRNKWLAYHQERRLT